MFKNYIKIAWRNLWRNKTYSLVNILGLTAGTVCCLYILIYVKEQFDFDKHHKDADRIFRVTTDIVSSEKTERMSTVSPVILPAVQKDLPEIEEAVRVIHRPDVDEHLFQTAEKSIYITKGYYADSNFFRVFTYQSIDGSLNGCLDKPLSIVISSSMARSLFGNESAVNKTITMTDRFGKNDYLVTAVFDESNVRSHMRPNFIMNIFSGRLGRGIRISSDWAHDNYAHGYVKLKRETAVKAFEKKLTSYVAERGKEQLAEAGYSKKINLQPIRDIHVYSKLMLEIDKNSNARFLFILISIASFIQLIACINFMNLSTARSASRAKEIGVRKSAGAARSSVIKQFLGESLLMTCVAVGLALPVLYVLLPYFNSISQYTLSIKIFNEVTIWLLIIGLIIITGLMAGSYPAFYLSSFNPIDVLKGKLTHRLASVNLRRGLVVFQFAVSVGLIIAVMTIGKQLNYMQERDLGFDKEQKLVIPIRSREAILKIETYKNEIEKLAEVKKAAGVLYYLGFRIDEDIDLYTKGRTIKDARRLAYNLSDDNYFEAMGIRVVAGRSFTRADTLGQIIINETAAKELGIATIEAPGQNLYSGTDSDQTTYKVIGVVKDFNFASLHEKIKPLFFRYNYKYPHLIVASRTSDYPGLIAKLQTAWKRFSPQDPFEYSFLDENLQQQYATERTLLKIINSFTVLAIFICCLGLFGLVAFTAEQRVKEIGIRKVLGASVSSITVLLSKEFLKLVGISILIVSPIAWYLMNNWLSDFAYRIKLSWWLFMVAGILAILVALITLSFQAIKTATANPVKSLRTE